MEAFCGIPEQQGRIEWNIPERMSLNMPNPVSSLISVWPHLWKQNERQNNVWDYKTNETTRSTGQSMNKTSLSLVPTETPTTLKLLCVYKPTFLLPISVHPAFPTTNVSLMILKKTLTVSMVLIPLSWHWSSLTSKMTKLYLRNSLWQYF
jgi:hypothetical protein